MGQPIIGPEVFRVSVPGELPTTNDILAWAVDRNFLIARKGEAMAKVTAALRKKGVEPVDPDFYPLSFLIVVKGRQVDTDNGCLGAFKVVLDAFQNAGIIVGDGPKQVKHIECYTSPREPRKSTLVVVRRIVG